MIEVDIHETLYQNLPEDIFKFYDVFRTTQADKCLENIVAGINYNSAVEIGTGNGLSALVLAKYCKGMVFTFDVVKRNAEFIWSFFPELRKRIYYVTGEQYYIDESIRHIFKESDFKIDFAFIDGEHTEEYCRHDFELVRECGVKRILFHDAHDPQIAPYMINVLKAQRIESLYAYWEEKAND
jgi:predicted O-methyltransferase YrrM